MIAAVPQPKSAEAKEDAPPYLENGDHLHATEFMRRYEAMPDVKAELINGIVYMASPTRFRQHGEPHGLIQGWLWSYSIATPGVNTGINATIRLGPDDIPQPDALLRIRDECGGQSRLSSKDYLVGAPELAVEIAASTASVDAREKRETYRRYGVREYLLWRTIDKAFNWWMLEEDEYRPLPPGAGGVLQSRIFPGLWLDPAALLAGDGAKVLATLQEGLRSPDHSAFVETLKQRPRPDIL
jgi:Uma2 family endonuclease